MNRILFTTSLGVLFSFTRLLISCKKEQIPLINKEDLVFTFGFDSTQEKLNNLGQPSTVPAGHVAQSPNFNGISAHYIELLPSMYTPSGAGEVNYMGPETTAGGDLAVDFDRAKIVSDGEEFYRLSLEDLELGVYHWIRVSLTYQNYEVDFRSNGLDLKGTFASFVGYNTYITQRTIKNQSTTINANSLQGYWAFELVDPIPFWIDDQAPTGATTVPNPLFSTSPIPQGSCLVRGKFEQPLVITGEEEEESLYIKLSVSNYNSFEYTDPNGNSVYEPDLGKVPEDMGTRGLLPKVTLHP